MVEQETIHINWGDYVIAKCLVCTHTHKIHDNQDTQVHLFVAMHKSNCGCTEFELTQKVVCE